MNWPWRDPTDRTIDNQKYLREHTHTHTNTTMQLPTSTAILLAAALGASRASAGPDLGMGEMLSGGSVLFPRQQGATGQNLQAFTGALGGIKADAVTNSGNSERPFEVDGDTFTDFNSAAQRSCDNQKNKCAQQANNGGNAGFEVSDCDSQNSEYLSTNPSPSLLLVVLLSRGAMRVVAVVAGLKRLCEQS